MLTSIKSDLFLLRDQFRISLLIFAFMMAFAYLQHSVSLIAFYAAFMSVFTPFTLAALSEQTGWEAVLLSTPVSRGGIVRGRYVVCLGLSACLLALGFVASMMMQPGIDNVYGMLIHFPIVLLFLSVHLPLIYKFGAQKARYALLLFSLLPSLLLFVAGGINSIPSLIAEHEHTLNRIFTSVPILLAINAVCLVMIALSSALSCYIYGKKEF